MFNNRISIFIFLFICLFHTHNISGQSNDLIVPDHSSEIIYFKTWGLLDFDDSYNYDCKNSLMKKNGFGFKIVAGCVVDSKELKKWKRHNKKVERKLKKRNGKNWRNEYEKELKKCKI